MKILVVFLSVCMGQACSNINEDNSIYPNTTRGDLQVQDSCPKRDQENVSVETVVQILFNKPLDPTTVNQSGVLLGSGRWLIAGNVFYDDRIVRYVPSEPLDPNTRYGIYITPNLRDEDGFAYTDSIQIFSFTTGDPGAIRCLE